MVRISPGDGGIIRKGEERLSEEIPAMSGASGDSMQQGGTGVHRAAFSWA